MPTFNPTKQAAEIVRPRLRLRQRKPRDKEARRGLIYSATTAKTYRHHLTKLARWAKENYKCRLVQISTALAQKYLDERARQVTDKSLNQDRLCLEMLPRIQRGDLTQPPSHVPPGRLAEEPRMYTSAQVDMIQAAQAENPHREEPHRSAFAFSTELARTYGLRAKELLTLRPLKELEESPDPKDRAILDKMARHEDKWQPERFHGMPEGVDYVVVGKGGLPRIEQLSHDHAERLEARRLPVPRDVTDRGNNYRQFYGIPGGRRWSDDFDRMSKRVLGWNLGGHALRHDFADDRMKHHRDRGLSDTEAEELTAQTLGHLRERSTRAYLRGEAA